MSKYIIEFGDKPSYQDDNADFYPCKQIPWWSVSTTYIRKLAPLDKALNEAYQKGYDEAKLIYQNPNAESDYQRGLDDAWETITTIAKMPDGERGKVFGDTWIANILNRNSLAEITEKLKANERQKADAEIKVGDEVEAYSGRAVVFGTFIDKNGDEFCRYWYPNEDRFDRNKTKKLKKTGRHFSQVAELLKVMKEGAE